MSASPIPRLAHRFPTVLTLTLDIPLKSNPVLDTPLDGLASLAENALGSHTTGRNVVGQRVRRDHKGDDTVVIRRRVDGELKLAMLDHHQR